MTKPPVNEDWVLWTRICSVIRMIRKMTKFWNANIVQQESKNSNTLGFFVISILLSIFVRPPPLFHLLNLFLTDFLCSPTVKNSKIFLSYYEL